MTSSSTPEHSTSPSYAHTPDAAHRRATLMLAVQEADNVLEALSNPQLNLAGWVTCDAAAIVMNQDVASLLGECENQALTILGRLHQAADSGLYPTDGAQPVTSNDGVLAIRFCPPEEGWILWFRESQDARWSDAEVSRAATLRADLLEACLQRATMVSLMQQRLISTLGHDLCNPLQSITMSAALLRPQSQRDTDLGQHIIAAGKKMSRLLGQVRDLNHLQSGKKININPVQTNLSELVDAVLKDEQALYPELVIEASVEAGIQAMVDAERYAEVIAHLLGNASHQSKHHTATTVNLQTHAGSSRLTIISRVEPLSAEHMAALLRPGASTASLLDQNNLGTGLFISAAIVQAHNGSVRAQQSEGSTTFCLELPQLDP